MASPTSHPHPQKHTATSHLTPASASSPPAPPSSHSGTNRSVPSPAYSAALKASSRSLHNRNGSANIPSGGTPRTGPTTSTPRPTTTSAAASPAATGTAAMLLDGQFGIPPLPSMGSGSGFTPRGFGLTPIAMQLTASQGGISAIAAAQDQEEERKRRIDSIVGMMSTRWGFVSQEGVERCARRLGLECLWEESMGEEGKRMLTIAGHGVLADVEFRGEEVQGVVLQFEGSRESVVAGAGAASEVLRKNLQGDESSGYVLLTEFVSNLERLANMDRLGGSEINCFDAVDGIRSSLDRIYARELGRLKKKNKEAARRVMCQESGRPVMHTRGHVGLSLQHWLERRLLLDKETTSKDTDMDIDNPRDDEDDGDSIVWSAIIECEASTGALFPPVRLSDSWVSEAVEKPPQIDFTNGPPEPPPIDWQDPPPTLLPPKSLSNVTGGLDVNGISHPRPPDIHFLVKFDPPVIVPLQTAIQIHASVGSPLSQESLLPTTFESLVFADIDGSNNNMMPATPRTNENIVTAYDPRTDTLTTQRHKSMLFTQPNDYARAITHLPFSHPRQIIGLLPTLRQWILTASILHRSFTPDSLDSDSDPLTTTIPATNGTTHHHHPHPPPPKTQIPPSTSPSPIPILLETELAEFLSSPLPSSSPSPSPSTNPLSSSTTTTTTISTTTTTTTPRAIDITLTTSPLPRFNVRFPNPSSDGQMANLAFSVGLNGRIEAVEVEVDGGSAEDGVGVEAGQIGMARQSLRERVKRVVEVGESVSVAVEWVLGSSGSASGSKSS